MALIKSKPTSAGRRFRIKITNPELDVWVITGDGDSLSIGGNHFIHLFFIFIGDWSHRLKKC